VCLSLLPAQPSLMKMPIAPRKLAMRGMQKCRGSSQLTSPATVPVPLDRPVMGVGPGQGLEEAIMCQIWAKICFFPCSVLVEIRTIVFAT
jgi:hypothetical protein